MKCSLSSRARRGAHVAAFTFAAAFAMSLSNATTLFTDGFESGNLSHTENGVAWIDSQSVAVTSSVAASGKYSLQFNFAGVPDGQDSWAEQRISLPQRSDYWFKYKLYIPTNYYHRTQTYEANNKFLAVYQAPYLKTNTGFQVNFSLEPNGSGGSDVEVHHYNGGVEGPVQLVYRNFITDVDKGKWMELIAEVKVPTSATSNDGVMKLWKNGQQVVNITNMASWGGTGKNYIDQAYFLGWSNSGFTQSTALNIDDVQIADSQLTSGTAAGAVTPNPPTNVTVQ
jgi:hypothetical protein